MRGIACFLYILFFSYQNFGAENSGTYFIHSEYRYDAIDYDKGGNYFIREKAGLTLGKSASAHCAIIHIKKTKTTMLTWNCFIKESGWYFLAGNFFLNFGYGLMLGMKQPLSSDQFKAQEFVSAGKSVRPCISGNPLYSYNGFVGGYERYFEGIDGMGSLIIFYSVKIRYATDEESDSHKIHASFSGLMNRYRREGNYSEALYVHDKGFLADLTLFRMFYLQLYLFHINASDAEYKTFGWKMDKQSFDVSKVSHILGYGIFIKYFDEYINIFLECGIPHTIVYNVDDTTRNYFSYAVLYGLEFRHHIFSFLFKGRTTEESFYSPYSSGGSYARNQWLVRARYLPIKQVRISGMFAVNKNVSREMYSFSMRTERLEEISVQYMFLTRGNLFVGLTLLERERESRCERRLRTRMRLKIPAWKYFSVIASAAIQINWRIETSYSAGGGFECFYKKYFLFNLLYSYFIITGKEVMYTRAGASKDSAVGGVFVRKDSHMFSIGVNGGYGGFSAFVRYKNIFSGEKIVNQGFECGGGMKF